MQTLKSLIFKPTPEEQKSKCNALLRSNARKLDRDIANLRTLESKTKALILSSSKRATKNPAAPNKQALLETRTFARELVRIRKQQSRLLTSKAQLASVQMQVNEAFSVRKIEGSLKASTGIMRDVNSLTKLPELTGTMQELSRELMKAGVIEEMVGDMLPDDSLDEFEDEEAESEIDKVLGEVLKDRMPKEKVPEAVVPSVPSQGEEQMEESDTEEMLDQMRGRLEALRS